MPESLLDFLDVSHGLSLATTHHSQQSSFPGKKVISKIANSAPFAHACVLTHVVYDGYTTIYEIARFPAT